MLFGEGGNVSKKSGKDSGKQKGKQEQDPPRAKLGEVDFRQRLQAYWRICSASRGRLATGESFTVADAISLLNDLISLTNTWWRLQMRAMQLQDRIIKGTGGKKPPKDERPNIVVSLESARNAKAVKLQALQQTTTNQAKA